jgi:hypothetical protein
MPVYYLIKKKPVIKDMPPKDALSASSAYQDVTRIERAPSYGNNVIHDNSSHPTENDSGETIKANFMQAIPATVTRLLAVVTYLAMFDLILVLEHWSFPRAVLCLIVVIEIQTVIIQSVTVFLTREVEMPSSSESYWLVDWKFDENVTRCSVVSQPLREFLCKLIESTLFARDFVIGHSLLLLQLPLVLVPRMDILHSAMIFWLWITDQPVARSAEFQCDSDSTTAITGHLGDTTSNPALVDRSCLKTGRLKRRRRKLVLCAFFYVFFTAVIVIFTIGPIFIPSALRPGLTEYLDKLCLVVLPQQRRVKVMKDSSNTAVS